MIEVQGRVRGDDPIVIADVHLYWRGACITAIRRNTFMLVTAEQHLIEIDPERVPPPSPHDMESFEGPWDRIRRTTGAELLVLDDEPGADEHVALQRLLVTGGDRLRVAGRITRWKPESSSPRGLYRSVAPTVAAAIAAEKVELFRISSSTVIVRRGVIDR